MYIFYIYCYFYFEQCMFSSCKLILFYFSYIYKVFVGEGKFQRYVYIIMLIFYYIIIFVLFVFNYFGFVYVYSIVLFILYLLKVIFYVYMFICQLQFYRIMVYIEMIRVCYSFVIIVEVDL